jgi:hypothetical protein
MLTWDSEVGNRCGVQVSGFLTLAPDPHRSGPFFKKAT